jgi:hypothetical protein
MDSVLPQPKIAKGPGVSGPNYSFAESIPIPAAIGVRDGDDFGAVTGAIKGVAYYSDVIGFGGPSTFMSNNMGLKPIGIQYWIKTGFTCSNGADMWTHVNSIAQGTSMGKGMAKTLSDAGLPAMRGLAPGILEDVQAALDPNPIMSAMFGTGFPVCKRVEMPVGDQDGRISTKDDKGNVVNYLDDPETVVTRGGVSYQTRWTLDHYTNQSEWEKAPKTFCPNGSANTGSCAKEGFCGETRWKQFVLVGAAAAGLLLLAYTVRGRVRR